MSDASRCGRPKPPLSAVTCKSTRYGEGCGHPVGDHIGKGDCCCCNWQHNDPAHVERCEHAFGVCRYTTVRP